MDVKLSSQSNIVGNARLSQVAVAFFQLFQKLKDT